MSGLEVSALFLQKLGFTCPLKDEREILRAAGMLAPYYGDSTRDAAEALRPFIDHPRVAAHEPKPNAMAPLPVLTVVSGELRYFSLINALYAEIAELLGVSVADAVDHVTRKTAEREARELANA